MAFTIQMPAFLPFLILHLRQAGARFRTSFTLAMPEVVSGLCHVDGINVIDGELLVRNVAVAVTAAVAAKRPGVCSKKITPVAAASPPVFRIAALQFVFPAPADPADFPQFPVFRLNPVHIFAGSNDRREAFECPPWIFSGMRCGTDFNIHGLSGAYHFPERS